MWAISADFFVEVPYSLLCCCIRHHHLTVDSEKHLADALLSWLDNNRGAMKFSTLLKDDYVDVLKTVRVGLLPFWFAAGKKRNCYFSKHAEESIDAIFNLIKTPLRSILHAIRDGGLDDIRIRLTDFTEKIDLSGCPQMTLVLLHLFLLPRSYDTDPTSRKRVEQSLIELDCFDLGKYKTQQNLFPVSVFAAVREVDVSKCPKLHLEAAINCFSKSFPSLRTLRVSYCLHFEMNTLFHLVLSCPVINEVDFTADVSPALPTQVTIISTTNDRHGNAKVTLLNSLEERPPTITKLTLEGRTDINDLDLLSISLICGFLSYLNLKGCTYLTDVGISKLIHKCPNLQSIILSDTCMGRNSAVALCSESLPGEHQKQPTSLASRLLKLHIGGCKSVEGTSLLQLLSDANLLRSLCLKGTAVNDCALYSFTGSSLQKLDVSDTMVSGASLAHVIRRNPGLKLIKSRGCRNLCYLESNLEENTLYSDCNKSDELYVEMGRICNLENVAFGWGFSSLSLECLGPAMKYVRVITVGLGASLSEHALMLLPAFCPLLESVVLSFQVISDSIVKNIIESSRYLQVLGLCYCLGDLSSLSFNIGMPCLRKLRLEWVVPWMTNDNLLTIAQSSTSLIELSLSGCPLLNADSQEIISCGWPGLISIHLEDCGEITSNGVSSLFNCDAIEDLSLRHNGRGMQRNVIVDAASKMPMLRKVALDLCDASEGGFDTPSYADRFFLSTVRIARCKQQKCAFDLHLLDACRKSVHKETIVLEWNSKGLGTTIVKERV